MPNPNMVRNLFWNIEQRCIMVYYIHTDVNQFLQHVQKILKMTWLSSFISPVWSIIYTVASSGWPITLPSYAGLLNRMVKDSMSSHRLSSMISKVTVSKYSPAPNSSRRKLTLSLKSVPEPVAVSSTTSTSGIKNNNRDFAIFAFERT